ncbi:AraC family transcriptional regulator [Gordonia rubripertincta]|uniref:AraC family transcriptional regulator n=1 Tax=Gordonia rubripertincta TaxID=36822 RepID=A0ABT4N1X7_GORRU|nr:AraC family transcriptional regulator [Gordonia rubripertincta]MCZ4553278.1 AraC family transcriptional regulator [Gordonia rubripertincta]
MDVLGSLLNGPRAKDAFLLRLVMTSPWSLRIEDEAPLTIVVTVSGTNTIRFDDGEQVIVRPGDVAIVRGPEPYALGDECAPTAIIDRNQHCTSLDGVDLVEELSLGVRSWGNSTDGESVSLVGTYGVAGEVSARLLAALPRLITLPNNNNPLISLLSAEIDRDTPGQEVMLDRLLDLVLIDTLRNWFSRPDSAGPKWIAAESDPVVGHALSLIHHNPGHSWTVAELAAECAVSRAALARRFTDLVGEPPMAYLTHWRLSMAADLLATGDVTLETVARQVGYSSAFALSAAFKRVRGVSPRDYRRSQAG